MLILARLSLAKFKAQVKTKHMHFQSKQFLLSSFDSVTI